MLMQLVASNRLVDRRVWGWNVLGMLFICSHVMSVLMSLTVHNFLFSTNNFATSFYPHRSRDSEREKQREKDRERKKKGLPPIKETHTSSKLIFWLMKLM